MKTKIWPVAVIFIVFVLSLCGCGQTGFLPQTKVLTITGLATTQTKTITVTTASLTVTVTSPVTTPIPTGQITKAAIRWLSPNNIVFTWSVTGLITGFEYWVYPWVGFTENSGPFGSTPEDEARNLESNRDLAITSLHSALGGNGSRTWGGAKPTNPTGKLALLAYNPCTKEAFVVALSSPIDTSSW